MIRSMISERLALGSFSTRLMADMAMGGILMVVVEG